MMLPAGDKFETSRQHHWCLIPQAVNTV